MFSGLVTRENSGKIREINETGKQPVPNAGAEPGPGRGCSRMLGTGNFPNFFGKYPIPGKWHSGTQTSKSEAIPQYQTTPRLVLQKLANYLVPVTFKWRLKTTLSINNIQSLVKDLGQARFTMAKTLLSQSLTCTFPMKISARREIFIVKKFAYSLTNTDRL